MTNSPESIDDLYKRFAPMAYRRARCVLGSEQEAHEVVQDIFLSLIERPEQFQGRSQFTTFIYSAVTHACLNRLRNQRNRLRLMRDSVIGLVPESDGSLSPEAIALLRSVLGRMPQEMAAVAVYYHLDGMTHDEIARVMGCSPRHVGNLLQDLTARVRRQEQKR